MCGSLVSIFSKHQSAKTAKATLLLSDKCRRIVISPVKFVASGQGRDDLKRTDSNLQAHLPLFVTGEQGESRGVAVVKSEGGRTNPFICCFPRRFLRIVARTVLFDLC